MVFCLQEGEEVGGAMVEKAWEVSESGVCEGVGCVRGKEWGACLGSRDGGGFIEEGFEMVGDQEVSAVKALRAGTPQLFVKLCISSSN